MEIHGVFCTKEEKHSNIGRTVWEKEGCDYFKLIMPKWRPISSRKYCEVPYEYVENDTLHWESCQESERKLNLWYSEELNSEGTWSCKTTNTSCALSLDHGFKLFCLLSLNFKIRCCCLKPTQWSRCCSWSRHTVPGQWLQPLSSLVHLKMSFEIPAVLCSCHPCVSPCTV